MEFFSAFSSRLVYLDICKIAACLHSESTERSVALNPSSSASLHAKHFHLEWFKGESLCPCHVRPSSADMPAVSGPLFASVNLSYRAAIWKDNNLTFPPPLHCGNRCVFVDCLTFATPERFARGLGGGVRDVVCDSKISHAKDQCFEIWL